MSDDKEFRAGAYSGLLAVIMVVALVVMAMTALNADPPPMSAAQLEQANDVHSASPGGVDSR